MSILDHFHPPLSDQRFWNAFHHAWPAAIARRLNRDILSDEYFASPSIQFGPRVEIDVGTFAETAKNGNIVVPTGTATYAASPATVTTAFNFLDTVEVQIFHQEGGPQLVAAIELVSPSNKDRPEQRRAFAAKMGSYLHQGIALIVVDIVTSRTSHLHNEWIELFQMNLKPMEAAAKPLYANSYRPLQKNGEAQLEMWLSPLSIGDELPNLPLYLRSDLCIEVPLNESYIETCEDQRIRIP